MRGPTSAPRRCTLPVRAMYLLAFLTLLLAPATLTADSIRYVEEGIDKEMPEVEILEWIRLVDGATFLAVEPDGTAWDFDLAEVTEIQFGREGRGALFQLQLGPDEDLQEFYNTTILSFKDGRFIAREQGKPQKYYLEVADVAYFERLSSTYVDLGEPAIAGEALVGSIDKDKALLLIGGFVAVLAILAVLVFIVVFFVRRSGKR